MTRLLFSASLATTLLAPSAFALDLSAALGTTAQGELTYRLGMSRDWNRQWLASETGSLTGYWDAGYTHWSAGEHRAAHTLSFSPVFVYQFTGEAPARSSKRVWVSRCFPAPGSVTAT